MELTTKGELINSYHLSFAKAYVTVYLGEMSNSLWILNEESEIFVNCDFQGHIILTYKTGIVRGEGVVVIT